MVQMRRRARSTQLRLGTAVAYCLVLALSTACGTLGSQTARRAGAVATDEEIAVNIPLDETGIADWNFLSPRQAYGLDPARLCRTSLVFHNISLGRTFVVEVQVPRAIGDPAASELIARIDGILEVLEESLANVPSGDDLRRSTLRRIALSRIESTATARHILGSEEEEQYLEKALAAVRRVEDPLVDRIAEIEKPAPGAATPSADLLLTVSQRERLDQGDSVKLDGFTLAGCSDEKFCTAVAIVAPHGSAALPASVFDPHRRCEAEPASPVLVTTGLGADLYRFDIRFFDDVESPTYGKGYLFVPTTGPIKRDQRTPVEPANTVKVALTASVGAQRDPDPERFVEGETLPDDGSKKVGDIRPFSLNRPFTGETRSRFTGAGSAEVAANLGSRADGKVTFGYKAGDLGGTDQDGTVKVSKYQFNAYGLKFLRLLFGRTEFLKPSSGLAIAISGEGFQIFRRGSSAGYLAERESEARVANREDRDSRLYFAAVDVLSLRRELIDDDGNSGLGRAEAAVNPAQTMIGLIPLNLYAVRGEEEGRTESLQGPYKHWTVGGEGGLRGTLAAGKLSWRGSLAAYWSRRDPEPEASIREGRGHVALLGLDLSYVETTIKGGKPTIESPRNLYVGYGFGSGDDPSTTGVDEGFIGKTAAFKPDKLFLSTLAGTIDPSTMIEPGGLPMGELGPSLSNKRYFTVRLTDNTVSLLDAFLGMLDLQDDLAGSKTIIAFHDYRFDEEVLGESEAGREYSLEFQAEAPKGVSISLGGALFETGKALRDVLQDDVWTLFSSVTVSIK